MQSREIHDTCDKVRNFRCSSYFDNFGVISLHGIEPPSSCVNISEYIMEIVDGGDDLFNLINHFQINRKWVVSDNGTRQPPIIYIHMSYPSRSKYNYTMSCS